MGVTENNTVSRWKLLKYSFFNVMTGAGSMGYGDRVSSENNLFFFGQYVPGSSVAHVAAHSMNRFPLESVQDSDIDKIASMNNRVASGKGNVTLSYKGLLCSIKMGVGKNPNPNDFCLCRFHVAYYTHHFAVRIEKKTFI
jgi:hypothetical protein